MLDLAGEYEKVSGILLRQWQKIKFWTVLKYDFLEDIEKIPSQCRIMKTCFTPISVIRGKHYSNNTNNMNYVQNNSKELAYVLITLGKYI